MIKLNAKVALFLFSAAVAMTATPAMAYEFGTWYKVCNTMYKRCIAGGGSDAASCKADFDECMADSRPAY